MPASHHNHPEPGERTPGPPKLIKHGKCWSEWPDELQRQIEHIARMQQQLVELGAAGLNWSDKDFTGKLEIAKIWPSLRTGSYPWPAQTKTRTKWREQLHALEQHAKTELLRHESVKAKELRSLSAEKFIEFAEHAAISRAIERAKTKTGTRSEERLVVFKARTRGGKTWLADQLVDEGKIDWRVDATPSWRRSYKAMLMSLCDMFGVAHAKKADALMMETNLIAHFKTLSGVVLFEEVQALCQDSQEFIKLLLNKSTLVVCIFVTNEAHEDMMAHGGNHLAQLLARAETTITASKISADIVRQFDPVLWKKADNARQLERVAESANLLGALSCVRRVTANVRSLLKDAPVITDEIIDKAINNYRRDVPVVATRVSHLGRPPKERRAA